MNDELVIFIGDDTGGTFGRKLEFTISVEEGTSLDGCSAEFVFDGITRTFAGPLVDGETREIVYTAEETAAMQKGVRYASFRVIDANGKVRTFTNTIRVRCTDIVAEVYPGTSGINITIGGGSVAWNDITGKPNFAPVATSGSYNDLTNKPTIPAAVTVDSALSDSSENPVQNKVVTAALNGKADKVANATSGNFAGLDANGNLTDSGKKAADFATPSEVESAITIISSAMNAALAGKENTSNKVVSISAQSTDAQYPSAKCVYDGLAGAVRYDLPTANAAQDMTAPMLPPDAFPVNVNGTDYTKSQISFSKTGDIWFMRAGSTEDVFAWSAAGVPDSSPISATVAFGELTNPPSLMFPYLLLDRTMNQLTLQTLPASGIALSFPSAQTGKVRDFLLRLEIPAGDAPQIAYPADVKFGNGDGSLPEINTTDTTGATAETILMFTETAPYVANATPAKFLVKGEAWNEIGGAA